MLLLKVKSGFNSKFNSKSMSKSNCVYTPRHKEF